MDILISGAGIAGTTLAYWLRRHGHQPTVVERAPQPRPGGQAIDIRGSALGVVERMGVLPEIRRHATAMRGMSWYSARGRKLVSLTEATLTGGLVGSDDVELLRDELTAILATTVPGIRYGDHITGLTQTDSGVDVTFAHDEPRRFDLVLGADGQHSAVRRLAFGPGFSHHLDGHLAVFTVPNRLGLDHWQAFHASPGRLAGVYSFREHTRAFLGFTSPPLKFDHRDRPAQERLVATAFADGGWEIPWLLSEMKASGTFFFDAISQIRMPHWTDGRVALVGDAGYGPSLMSGQGTSLALLGAYVLAGELKSGDHTTAFRRYTEIMRPVVRYTQALASHRPSQTRRGQWMAVQGMRVLPHLPFKNRMLARMTRPLTEAANMLKPKDY